MGMMETLQTMTAIYGPSGREGQVAEYISAQLTALGAHVRTDAMGNVIARIGGTGKRIAFAAHMDTVGVMVTRVDKDGYGWFHGVGWLDPASTVGTMVVFENGTMGVVCVKEEKLGEKLKLEDLYLDFGAKSREEAEKLVQIGDMGVFAPRFVKNGSRILSPYLDNRSGCAILLEAAARMKELKNEVYFLFTVQEEVGTRGAGPAAYGMNGAWGIAVDVTATDDVPGSRHDGTTVLGGGAGIKVLDRSALSRPYVIAAMEQTAETRKIPVQKDILSCGGTDAGPMSVTGNGMAVGGISLPCRYTHSPVEVCDENDLEACVQMVVGLAEMEL